MNSLQILKILVLAIMAIMTSGCLNQGTSQMTNPPNEYSTAISTQNTDPSPQDSGSAPGAYVPITAPEVVYPAATYELGKTFQRTFIWNHGGREWYLIMNFDDGIYNLYKSRSRSRDYDLFASDPYDDELIKSIANSLKKAGEDNGLSDSEIPYLAISLVQALPYTSDKVTTGYDEYPRFPYETLYDGGGDCEDTSILSSAILQEMGYGVVLIELPSHMAVGVKCNSDMLGYSYEFNGQRFCYLETTDKNWPVGVLPDEYKSLKAKIIPVYSRPALNLNFTYYYRYNYRDVYVDVDITVKNLGSETTQNTKIYVALQTSNTSRVWSQIESQYIQINPESSYTYNVKNLHVPTGSNFRVYVRAYGDNAVSDEAVGKWITWTKN